MEKIEEYKFIIVLAPIVLVVAFYWYEWRPSQIKKECYKVAEVKANVNAFLLHEYDVKKESDYYYKNCLIEKGL